MAQAISKDKLQNILSNHFDWVNDNSKGRCGNLSGYHLAGYDFRMMNLQNINFENTNLEKANFSKANLKGVNFKNANILGVNFHRAEMDDTGIIQFRLNQHLATYHDGKILLDCLWESVDYWIKNGEKIGKSIGYDEKEIKAYMSFIDICKDFS